jgi:hypothetical protein
MYKKYIYSVYSSVNVYVVAAAPAQVLIGKAEALPQVTP